MNVDTVVRRRSDMAHSSMGGEVIILSEQTSRYLGLEGVGARIWELLDEPRTLGELVNTLGAEYDVEEHTLLSDLRGFIVELEEKRLVEVGSAP